MNLFSIDQEKDIANQCRKALHEEKKLKKPEVNLYESVSNLFEKLDHGKVFYKEFDQEIFETKVQVDMMYLKHLLRNLPEEFNENVHELIKGVYKDVHGIYEFTDIEPQIHGKNIKKDILNESLEKATSKIIQSLNETLDHLFYKLTPDQRIKKFGDKAKNLAEVLVTENNDLTESIQFSIKVSVLEETLTKIMFPTPIWNRVKYLSESEDFGKVFDQQELVNLIENYEKQINTLAKYLTTAV